MTGMEMLISTAIRALGLKPEEVQKQVFGFIEFGQQKIKEFDLRLAQMEQKQHEIHAMLLRQQGDGETAKANVAALLQKVSIEQSEAK